jgi:hypothetical protein
MRNNYDLRRKDCLATVMYTIKSPINYLHCLLVTACWVRTQRLSGQPMIRKIHAYRVKQFSYNQFQLNIALSATEQYKTKQQTLKLPLCWNHCTFFIMCNIGVKYPSQHSAPLILPPVIDQSALSVSFNNVTRRKHQAVSATGVLSCDITGVSGLTKNDAMDHHKKESNPYGLLFF